MIGLDGALARRDLEALPSRPLDRRYSGLFMDDGAGSGSRVSETDAVFADMKRGGSPLQQPA